MSIHVFITIFPSTNIPISSKDGATLRQRHQHIRSINQDGVLIWRRAPGDYHQSRERTLNTIGDASFFTNWLPKCKPWEMIDKSNGVPEGVEMLAASEGFTTQ